MWCQCCLGSCAKHSLELAEVVVEAEVFPSVLLHLAHRCPQVRRNAAALVRDVVKHSVDLALYVVNMGGIGALIEALSHRASGANNCDIPCITALGYIAGDVKKANIVRIVCEASKSQSKRGYKNKISLLISNKNTNVKFSI